MRNVRQLCAATFLTLIVTISAFAGEMQTTGITNQPTDQQTPGTSVTGQISTPLIPDADQAAQIALTLIANALSVF